jgi:hypothetical protein
MSKYPKDWKRIAARAAERAGCRCQRCGAGYGELYTRFSGRVVSEKDLYELAKILGHSNIKMTERYAKLAKQHIARTSNTAREMWKLLEPISEKEAVG